MKKVCMLGEGAWGTAIATVLAYNCFDVQLWCYDAQVAKSIEQTGYNDRYLPGIKLPKTIVPYTALKNALADAVIIFEAIPVQYLRGIVKECKPFLQNKTPWVLLSKGIEQTTLAFPTDIVESELGVCQKAVLAGPSFAQEVAQQKITAVTLAVSDCSFGIPLQKMLANTYFRPYLSLDLVGTQVGAALKNVITLGIGMLDGAGFADNAKALFFTRGFHEIVQVAQALGAHPQTLYGLSGIGDLVLTSMGSLSKNLAVGKRLGRGESLHEILQKTGYIPEGVNTVQALKQLMKEKNLNLPLCQGIYSVLFEEKSVATVLEDLMQQPLEPECKELFSNS